jgi:hypothetical protein
MSVGQESGRIYNPIVSHLSMTKDTYNCVCFDDISLNSFSFIFWNGVDLAVKK